MPPRLTDSAYNVTKYSHGSEIIEAKIYQKYIFFSCNAQKLAKIAYFILFFKNLLYLVKSFTRKFVGRKVLDLGD